MKIYQTQVCYVVEQTCCAIRQQLISKNKPARCVLENNLKLHARYELSVRKLIEEWNKLTQRAVAADFEIAIGIVYSSTERFVLKVKDVLSSRYGYYLKPQGFLAKSQSVSKHIANLVDSFEEVRRDAGAIAKKVSRSKHRTVGCIGTDGILEIYQMVFQSQYKKIRFVVDVFGHCENQHYKSVSEVPLVLMDEIDYLVVTKTKRPHKAFEIISTGKHESSILPPALTKIIPKSGIN